jgi:SAM-dependent methyltransferase
MPFGDGAFDVAMSRFAFHHLPDPAAVAAEMARVVRPGGHLAVMDMVSGGARHDELEILRDPSHTRALDEAELHAMLGAVGAEIVARDERRGVMPAERWLRQARPDDERAAHVRSALEAEADGGEPTGLEAHRDADGVLHVAQRWLLIVARR